MSGVLLAALSNFFLEISDSIGKYEVKRGAVSFYTFGFLSVFFGTVILVAQGFVRNDLVFSLASLPTFLPRIALEILQAHVMARAITISDRGDFGFVRTLTIPILLIIDIFLGYTIGIQQILGMILILSSVLVLVFIERGHIRGKAYLLIGTVNAALTISLYKYDISHFNSVAAEQGLVSIAIMAYFFVLARYSAGENPFRYLRRRVFFAQSFVSGLAGVASSFAYTFAPASVITAGLRSSAVLFAMLSGKIYFRERHFFAKAILFVLVITGFLLLIP